MCLSVCDIWKTQFLLLIPHKLLNKSKNTALPLPLALITICEVEINSKLFRAGTILHWVSLDPLPLHFYLIYPCRNAVQRCANNWNVACFSSRWKTVRSSSGA